LISLVWSRAGDFFACPWIASAATLQLRKLEPARTQPAALVLAARAWIGKDRRRALSMLRLAVDAETAHPSYDGGGLDYAFDQLAQAAVNAGRYDEAADLRRLQAARIGMSRDAYPMPVFELLALHARFGPLEGFASDVARFSEYTGQPQSLYAIGKLYERCGRGAVARACFTAASAASLTPTHRFLVARFLREQGWNDLAEPELHALARGRSERADAPGAFNANIILAMMAQEPGGDDAAAADHYEAACRALVARREAVTPPDLVQYLNEQIALRRFLAARAAHDDDSARRFADRVIELRPTRSEPLVEVIPYLRSLGRDAEAQQLFDRAYADAQQRSAQDPDDPASLNEIAWLAGRTGERPKEALELATRAVAEEPDTAAYLDTAAEANFRCGNVDEAIRLERRALELEPDHRFFAEQLSRFESGNR
jgi:tetratricopeptide (TPR) repeat protein